MPDLNLKNGLWTRQQIADHTGFNRNTLKSEFVKRDIFPTETGGTDTKPIDYYTVKQWGPVVYGGASKSGEDLSLKEKDDLLKEKAFEEVRRLRRENDIQEGLNAPVAQMTQALALVATEASNIIDSIPPLIQSMSRDINGRTIERIEKDLIPVKNRFANLGETTFNADTLPDTESDHGGVETVTHGSETESS